MRAKEIKKAKSKDEGEIKTEWRRESASIALHNIRIICK